MNKFKFKLKADVAITEECGEFPMIRKYLEDYFIVPEDPEKPMKKIPASWVEPIIPDFQIGDEVGVSWKPIKGFVTYVGTDQVNVQYDNGTMLCYDGEDRAELKPTGRNRMNNQLVKVDDPTELQDYDTKILVEAVIDEENNICLTNGFAFARTGNEIIYLAPLKQPSE